MSQAPFLKPGRILLIKPKEKSRGPERSARFLRLGLLQSVGYAAFVTSEIRATTGHVIKLRIVELGNVDILLLEGFFFLVRHSVLQVTVYEPGRLGVPSTGAMLVR